VPNGVAVSGALAKPEPEQPTAWVCAGTACLPPTTDLAALGQQETP